MVTAVLALLGVFVFVIAIVDLCATESIGVWIVGLLLSASVWIAVFPRGHASEIPKMELPALNRGEHPLAYWLVVIGEAMLGSALVWPWLQRTLDL